jgi:hypothetical protein
MIRDRPKNSGKSCGGKLARDRVERSAQLRREYYHRAERFALLMAEAYVEQIVTLRAEIDAFLPRLGLICPPRSETAATCGDQPPRGRSQRRPSGRMRVIRRFSITTAVARVTPCSCLRL